MPFVGVAGARIPGSCKLISALLGASTLEGDHADSLQSETNVLVINGKTRRALVRDTTTPANAQHVDMSGATDFLTYTSPSSKRIIHADGLLKFAAHNRALYSEDLDTTGSAKWTGLDVETGYSDRIHVSEQAGAQTPLVKQTHTLAAGSWIFECKAKVGSGIDNLILKLTLFDVNPSVNFSIANGTVDASTGTELDSGIDAADADGYRRCWMAFSLTGSDVVGDLNISPTESTSTLHRITDPDGTQYMFVKEARISRYPSDSHYLKTTTAARYALPVDHDVSSLDTSTTSITLGAGSHTITKATSGGYSVGDEIRLSAQANVDGQYMVGKVTAASGTSVTFNVPSADYVTGSGTIASWYIIKPEGILREPAATNLVETSDFTNATYWSKYSTATIAASTAVNAPDGTTHRLYKYTEADTSANNALTWAGTTISASTNYTQSIYMKADTATWAMFFWRDGSGSNQFKCWANIATGAKGTLEAGIGRVTSISHNITALANGWYRIDFTGSTTGTNLQLLVSFTTGDNTTNRAGSNASAYVWCPQAESGSTPTSAILTYGSTVTRAADQPTLATTAFPWDASNDFIVWKGKVTKAARAQTLLVLDDGTANERIRLYTDASGNILLQVTDGGADQLAPLDSAVNASDDTEFTVAIRIKANDVAISVNGNAAVKDTSVTLPTVTTLRLGYDTGGNHMSGEIAHVKAVPREPTDANLVSEST